MSARSAASGSGARISDSPTSTGIDTDPLELLELLAGVKSRFRHDRLARGHVVQQLERALHIYAEVAEVAVVDPDHVRVDDLQGAAELLLGVHLDEHVQIQCARLEVWVRSELEDFRPDLLVIDTLMAACAVGDTNDNTEAVRVMKALRALAREFECAILLLHHERKRSKDNPSSSGQAMMGARQWAGQADAQMTLTVESDLVEDEGEEEGHRRLRRTFKFRPAEKDRDGASNVARRVAVESEKDAAGRLLWMTVTDEGPITEETRQEGSEDGILAALQDAGGEGVLTTAALATIAGENNPTRPCGTFKRALAAAHESGRIESVKRGHWKITDHGRQGAALVL